MQVSIDRSKCQGHGRCAFVAPELFELDDDGVAVVRQHVQIRKGDRAQRAVLSCPEHAIIIREEVG
jgi:ferredoxin